MELSLATWQTGENIFFTAIIRDITEKKKAEEFSWSLLNNSPNPIIVINLDSSIKYINPALEKLTGYPRDEIIGKVPPYP